MTFRKTSRHLDRTGWPDSPWDDEPDLVEWVDEASSLPCRIERPKLGHLCGYVGIAERHPWYRVDDSRIEPPPDVHGGLTFSDTKPSTGALWWLGFDCAHMNDFVPGMAITAPMARGGETYKNLAFVEAECAGLAAQIARAANG